MPFGNSTFGTAQHSTPEHTPHHTTPCSQASSPIESTRSESPSSFDGHASALPRGYPDHQAPVLHHAIANAQLPAAEYLLTHGADPLTRSAFGLAARELAAGCLMVSHTTGDSVQTTAYRKLLRLLDQHAPDPGQLVTQGSSSPSSTVARDAGFSRVTGM